MKAPSAGFRILYRNGIPFADIPAYGLTIARPFAILSADGRIVWRGKTFKGARNAHYRLSVAKLTGKPVSAAQARRAGNA